MNDDQKALLIVAALIFGSGNTTGFVGGRFTAPAPQAEVRVVRLPSRPMSILPPPVESAPERPAAVEPAEPLAPAEPPAPVAEAKPVLPTPRPKVVEPPPRPKSEKPVAKKPRPSAPASKGLPSCAVIKREYERMSVSERWAAYRKATPEQVAQGKRCLGF